MSPECEHKQGWQVDKICTDVNNYELSVERQKTSFHCTQKRESWKWFISLHGTIIASGSVNNFDEAKQRAIASVPV